jgi:hypothetical protein
VLQYLYLIGILFYSYRTYFHQKINFASDERNFSLTKMQDFKRLSGSGIIANYWFSYIFGIDSDLGISATPCEFEYVRKPAMVDSVFSKKRIYLIKNSWFENFPGSIVQFGRTLVPNGSPQVIDGLALREYSVRKFYATYFPKDLKTSDGVLKPSGLTDSSYVISTQPKEYKSEFFLFGPFIDLKPGDYRTIFNVSYNKFLPSSGEIIFDVSENWGSRVLVSKNIDLNSISSENTIQNIELIFHNPSLIHMVEFRIKINGKTNLNFHSVKIEQI